MNLRIGLAILAVTCSACQSLLGLEPLPSATPDAQVDGRADAPAPDAPTSDAAPCEMPQLSDDFQGTTACTWGSSVGAVQSGSGELVATVGGSSTLADCLSNSPDQLQFTRDAGVFVEVAVAPSSDNDYTELRVFGAGGEGTSITVSGGVLTEYDNANLDASTAVPYDAQAMAWWRLIPVAGGIEADYSSDGRSWQMLAEDTLVTPPAGVRIQLATGCNVGDPTASATFRHLDVCPQ